VVAAATAAVAAMVAAVVDVAGAADATATGAIVAGTAIVGKTSRREAVSRCLSLFALPVLCYPCFTLYPIWQTRKLLFLLSDWKGRFSPILFLWRQTMLYY
jgi:hypothetical protein